MNENYDTVLGRGFIRYTMVTLIIINISHPFHMYVQISSAHRNGCPLHPQQNIGAAVGNLSYITVKAN